MVPLLDPNKTYEVRSGSVAVPGSSIADLVPADSSRVALIVFYETVSSTAEARTLLVGPRKGTGITPRFALTGGQPCFSVYRAVHDSLATEPLSAQNINTSATVAYYTSISERGQVGGQ